MNRLKLKETMDQIHMKEEMQKEIIMKVKRQTDRRAFGKKRLHSAAPALVYSPNDLLQNTGSPPD